MEEQNSKGKFMWTCLTNGGLMIRLFQGRESSTKEFSSILKNGNLNIFPHH